MLPPVTIVEANLDQPDHQREIIKLTSAYAADSMGNAGPLPPDVLARLIPGLQAHPTTIILLAYAGRDRRRHRDLFPRLLDVRCPTAHQHPRLSRVARLSWPRHRPRVAGSRRSQSARDGLRRVTLEVQERNTRARHIYESAGFAHAAPGHNTGGSLFFTKTL